MLATVATNLVTPNDCRNKNAELLAAKRDSYDMDFELSCFSAAYLKTQNTDSYPSTPILINPTARKYSFGQPSLP